MAGQFTRIGIFSKPHGQDIAETVQHLQSFLKNRKHEVVKDIGTDCDLVIVVGGDGSMLKAARSIVDYNIPIIGINRGNLGFLADINPQFLEQTLEPILQGEYQEELRTMLHATVIKDQKLQSEHLALNDVVLHHGDIARLIEFQVYIDDQFVLDQRSDGLITATPTGSTAYALSGGGPIIYPTLDVLSLVSMFPHTLSARPIVVNKNSTIRLVVTQRNDIAAKFSCDGQSHMSLNSGDEILIKAHVNNLRLLHPKGYSYYKVLQEKLGWNLKLQSGSK